MKPEDHVFNEIRQVAQLLDNLQFNMRQPWYEGKSANHVVDLRDRLRRLIPQPESLESVVEALLMCAKRNQYRNGKPPAWEWQDEDIERLRAALAAVRGRAGRYAF